MSNSVLISHPIFFSHPSFHLNIYIPAHLLSEGMTCKGPGSLSWVLCAACLTVITCERQEISGDSCRQVSVSMCVCWLGVSLPGMWEEDWQLSCPRSSLSHDHHNCTVKLRHPSLTENHRGSCSFSQLFENIFFNQKKNVALTDIEKWIGLMIFH